jgi:hypothetical protein
MYAYCGNDAFNLWDPSGLDWFGDGTYVVGREGTIVPPGRGVGKFIDDLWPAGHTFGTRHDQLTGFLKDDWHLPDPIVNVPTMPIVYVEAVAEEIVKTPVRIVRAITNKMKKPKKAPEKSKDKKKGPGRPRDKKCK